MAWELVTVFSKWGNRLRGPFQESRGRMLSVTAVPLPSTLCSQAKEPRLSPFSGSCCCCSLLGERLVCVPPTVATPECPNLCASVPSLLLWAASDDRSVPTWHSVPEPSPTRGPERWHSGFLLPRHRKYVIGRHDTFPQGSVVG